MNNSNNDILGKRHIHDNQKIQGNQNNLSIETFK